MATEQYQNMMDGMIGAAGTRSMGRMDGMTAAELGDVETHGLKKADILERVAHHDLMDELKVGSKYLDYAVALETECPETSHLFAEMAKEEFSHAHYQRDLLLKNGYSMTEDGESAYHELKERLKQTFR